MDETYLKVRGRWVYLYRAVDKQGKTVESDLSRTRDVTAAKAFFRKAFRRHDDPRVITLDGFEPTHAALSEEQPPGSKLLFTDCSRIGVKDAS